MFDFSITLMVIESENSNLYPISNSEDLILICLVDSDQGSEFTDINCILNSKISCR